MEGNVYIHSNAYQEFVMMKQLLVKEDKRENLAVITQSVIMVQHVELRTSGHLEHNVYQCQRLAPTVSQIMIASQETFVGSSKKEMKVFAQKNTRLLTKHNFFGSTISTQLSIRHLYWHTEHIVNQGQPSKSLKMLLNALPLIKFTSYLELKRVDLLINSFHVRPMEKLNATTEKMVNHSSN